MKTHPAHLTQGARSKAKPGQPRAGPSPAGARAPAAASPARARRHRHGPSPALDLTRALAFFEQWASTRLDTQLMPGQRLSASATRSYRFIWQAWVRHLACAQPPTAWTQAQPTHVLAFLAQAQPTRTARGVSFVTRRRYWRVLARLYEFAHQRGLVSTSPALAVQARERPAHERKASASLDAAIVQALWQCLPAPGEAYMAERDRAIVALTLLAGLTPQEIRTLQLAQVQGLAPAQGLQQGSQAPGGAPSEPTGFEYLALQGPRSAQARNVALGSRACTELQRWLAQRPHLRSSRASDLVFLSERGALSVNRLHFIVREAIVRACEHLGREIPAHFGPSMLRNTALAARLNEGHPAADVARWAGLKDEKSLWRLLQGPGDAAH